VASRVLGRRAVLTGFGAIAVSLVACEARSGDPRGSGAPDDVAPCRGPSPRWPGHRPCRVYLGLSSPADIATVEEETGPVGVHRSYFSWDDLSREADVIRDDHRHRRLPWVSFKPPTESSGGWAMVASGDFDDDLRERARRYARRREPVVVTFHHEPSNDDTGTPEEFVAAWTHAYDVMFDETGLPDVAFVPVIGEWEFNPVNPTGDPDRWVTAPILDRAAFLGVDIYQNAGGEAYPERLGRVRDWLDEQGREDVMLGVGETGCTDTFGHPDAVEWWTRSWQWVEDNAATIAVVSYFDSGRNSREGVDWPLAESPDKLEAFRDSLGSAVACRLPR
jgi:hypothetical protein